MNCGRYNHFAKMCCSHQSNSNVSYYEFVDDKDVYDYDDVNDVNYDEVCDDFEQLYVWNGNSSKTSWCIDVQARNSDVVNFKLDTGAKQVSFPGDVMRDC